MRMRKRGEEKTEEREYKWRMRRYEVEGETKSAENTEKKREKRERVFLRLLFIPFPYTVRE